MVTDLSQQLFASNQYINLDQSEAKAWTQTAKHAESLTTFSAVNKKGLSSYKHVENLFVDFDRDRLLHHMLSTQGPSVASGDLNGDGLNDVVIGGAKNQPMHVLFATATNGYELQKQEVWNTDAASEDLDIALFDADNDDDLDIYVCSGGNEFSNTSFPLRDRLYLNNGDGQFTKSDQILPTQSLLSTSAVDAGDFDGDGDTDLFVGVRVMPFNYGLPCDGYILRNDGDGIFKDVTQELGPELLDIGMITDAKWIDLDNDTDLDLVVTGDWMPLSVFINNNGKFNNKTDEWNLSGTSGWWNKIHLEDLNGDGKKDLIAGNLGLNSRFRASADKPLKCYVNDFDANGSIEQIITGFYGDTSYPLVLRHDLVMQMPSLKKQYLLYADYKLQTIEDIFPADILNRSVVHQATDFKTSVFLNKGK